MGAILWVFFAFTGLKQGLLFVELLTSKNMHAII